MIEAIDLTKRYSTGRLALDALNLRVRPGEIHCLLGASGAGKSTALHLLLGFLEPTAGRALIDGIDARREPLLARSHSAYLAGGTAFYERLTARQNLSFFAALGG
ncbi:MAG TPA: ATP-binding cassette domain-containing protein, partial [Thermoanaerobaculia bacterium]|nr:ATP-binding cassette domain-containing protein [Thermoanaerobaculia bacterium]